MKDIDERTENTKLTIGGESIEIKEIKLRDGLKVYHPLTGVILWDEEEELSFDHYKAIEGVLFVYSGDEGDMWFATEEVAHVAYHFGENGGDIGPGDTADLEETILAANQMASNPMFIRIEDKGDEPEPVVVIGLDLAAQRGGE